MKKILIGLFIVTALMRPTNVKADELIKCTATAYTHTGNLTYTETIPRVGVAAGKREWLGKIAFCYLDDGDGQIKPENFLSILSFEDLGGTQAIKNGWVIDVFLNTKDEAKQFGAKKVILQIINSEG